MENQSATRSGASASKKKADAYDRDGKSNGNGHTDSTSRQSTSEYKNGDRAGPSNNAKRAPKKETDRSGDGRGDGGKRKYKDSSHRSSSESHTADSGAESVDDETIQRCKEFLRPVKKSLYQLRDRVGTSSNEEKIALVKEHLGAIGNRIVEVVRMTANHKRVEMKKNLWKFVFFYWPHKETATPERVAAMYEKIVQGTKTQEHSPQMPEDRRQDRGRSSSPRRVESKRRRSPTPDRVESKRRRSPTPDRDRDRERDRERDYDRDYDRERDYDRDYDRDEKRRRPNTSRPDPPPFTNRKRRWEEEEDERRVRRA